MQVQTGFPTAASGSVLIQSGQTIILCTASIEDGVPSWMKNQPRGWLTAEYNMLPGSTSPRKSRDRSGKVDGRTTEIQRLIGRSLRSVVDMEALGPVTITVDCDVLQADGGTRTASITGGWIALALALNTIPDRLDPTRPPLRGPVAAISVGIVDGRPVLDLDYSEDSRAEVDLNVVMTGDGQLVEVQGTAEGQTFNRQELNAMLDLAEPGIRGLIELQRSLIPAAGPAIIRT